jgi:DNA-directed RNA polymerase subunit RPC12/RpoP
MALVWNLPSPLPEEGKAMKRVCAWCGGELDPFEGCEDIQVTHGVCPICRDRFFPKAVANETDSQPTREDVSNDPGRTGGHAPTK